MVLLQEMHAATRGRKSAQRHRRRTLSRQIDKIKRALAEEGENERERPANEAQGGLGPPLRADDCRWCKRPLGVCKAEDNDGRCWQLWYKG